MTSRSIVARIRSGRRAEIGLFVEFDSKMTELLSRIDKLEATMTGIMRLVDSLSAGLLAERAVPSGDRGVTLWERESRDAERADEEESAR